jgi:hypothetical protein
MKKIAFCFNGLLRTAEYNVKNILHQVDKIDGDVDFFIHTWVENTSRPISPKSEGFLTKDESGSCNRDLMDWARIACDDGYRAGIESRILPTEDVPISINDVRKDSYSILHNLQDIYNFKSVEIEPQSEFDFKRYDKLYTLVPMHWYSWWKSIQLKSQYEKIYKMKYDCVISTRPDIMFPKDFNIQKDIELVEKNEKIFFATGVDYKGGRRPNDIYFISSSDVMDSASSYCFPERNGVGWDIENNKKMHVGEFIMKQGIDVEEASPWPERWAVYRDECIGIDPFDLKKAVELDNYWYRPWKHWDFKRTLSRSNIKDND